MKYLTVSKNAVPCIRGYKRQLNLLPPHFLEEKSVHRILYSPRQTRVYKRISKEVLRSNYRALQRTEKKL